MVYLHHFLHLRLRVRNNTALSEQTSSLPALAAHNCEFFSSGVGMAEPNSEHSGFARSIRCRWFMNLFSQVAINRNTLFCFIIGISILEDRSTRTGRWFVSRPGMRDSATLRLIGVTKNQLRYPFFSDYSHRFIKDMVDNCTEVGT